MPKTIIPKFHHKTPFKWTSSIHKRFLAAIFDYGLQRSTPKPIRVYMQPVPNTLTTEHIKSHLQVISILIYII